MSIVAGLAQALLSLLQQNEPPCPKLKYMSFPDAMREVFTNLERRISEDPASAGLLCSVLTRVVMLTPTELEKCMNLFNGDAAPAYTHFQWGRSARCVRIDGPRILADAGPAKVGAALSMEACADGAHSWTLRRISALGFASLPRTFS